MLNTRKTTNNNKGLYVFSILFGISFAVWSLLSMNAYSHSPILDYKGIFSKYEKVHAPGFGGGVTSHYFHIDNQVFHMDLTFTSFDKQFFEDVAEGDMITIEYIKPPKIALIGSKKTDKAILSLKKGSKYYINTETSFRKLNEDRYHGIGLGAVFAIAGAIAIIFDLK